MLKIKAVVMILLFVFWLKDTTIFCDYYEKYTAVTHAYQNERLIAVIDNRQITRVSFYDI
jgi:hypothetical protein